MSSIPISANIFPPTLNTSGSGPKGKPSVVSGRARQYARISSRCMGGRKLGAGAPKGRALQQNSGGTASPAPPPLSDRATESHAQLLPWYIDLLAHLFFGDHLELARLDGALPRIHLRE